MKLQSQKSVIILFFIFFTYSYCYSQDSEQNHKMQYGLGMAYFPEGEIFGISNTVSYDYCFSKHFASAIKLVFADGEKSNNSFFDYAKTNAFSAGLAYIPIEKIPDFKLGSYFSVLLDTKIFGTKDESFSEGEVISKLTTYKRDITYGVSLEVQYPLCKFKDFVITADADCFLSWLNLEVATVSLNVGYKF